ncbi:DUF317 domain-containing protein [Streptomyces sp. NPDC055103]
MTSPDHSHWLTIDPGSRRTCWHIAGRGKPNWSMWFSGSAPVEIVAAVTDALVRPVPQENGPTIVGLLTDAHWQHTPDKSGDEQLLSPDGTIVVSLHLSDVSALHYWSINVAGHHDQYGPQQRLWSASLDGDAPPHLLAALAGALIDPAPVLRTRFEVPSNQRLDVGAEFEIHDQVVAAHTRRLAEARRHHPKNLPVTGIPAPNASAAARPASRR